MDKVKELKPAKEQDTSPKDEEEELSWDDEVCSAAQVFSFFSKYFNAVGIEDVKMEWTDAYAIGHVFKLCEERIRRILP